MYVRPNSLIIHPVFYLFVQADEVQKQTARLQEERVSRGQVSTLLLVRCSVFGDGCLIILKTNMHFPCS